jgi:hypothetical protein
MNRSQIIWESNFASFDGDAIRREAQWGRWFVGMIPCEGPRCEGRNLASLYADDLRAEPWLRRECAAGDWGDITGKGTERYYANKRTIA